MKSKKKIPAILPEVHIIGDLNDIRILIKGLNKKKTVVIFRDPVRGEHYAEIDGEVELFPQEMIAGLEKEYRFIYFDFFPDRKQAAPEAGPEGDPVPVTPAPELAPVPEPEQKTVPANKKKSKSPVKNQSAKKNVSVKKPPKKRK